MNIFKIITNKYKAAYEKPELSAKSAYVLSVLNKQGEVNDVYKNFEKKVLNEINNAARFGEIELYIPLPNYLMKDHREKLYKTLEDKGFKIVYKSYKSIVVNWEQL